MTTSSRRYFPVVNLVFFSGNPDVCRFQGVEFPMFVCSDKRASLHFTLVCDHITQCTDKSDEHFCVYEQCPSSSFLCANKQCVPFSKRLDGKLMLYKPL